MSGLRAEQVSLRRCSQRVLDHISLAVNAGEFVALIGPNGAGKSTLLKALAGELRPWRGRCLLDGFDVHRTSSAELARHRAVLPQDITTDFPLPVADIIELGRAPWQRHASLATNRRAVNAAVRAVDAGALLTRNYANLSGGERQRVQLARVLAQIWDAHWDDTPRYLLLDEPTASLDIGHQQRLLTLVRRVLSQLVGVLAVLHDLNLASAFADRLILLHHGRIAAEGPPASVLQAPLLNTVYAAELSVHPNAKTQRPIVSACTNITVTEC